MKKQILIMAFLILGSVAHADELVDSLKATYGEANIEVIDLTGQGVACGYTDVDSEVNDERFGKTICAHFGLGEKVGHRCGWKTNQNNNNVRQLTTFSKNYIVRSTEVPIAIPLDVHPQRKMGLYEMVVCLRKGNQ